MRRTTTTDPHRAVAYLRASTDDQALSPDAQRAAIVSWATREGVTIIAWHVDQGVSGAADLVDRPALAAALGSLRAEGAGLLVVARRDRLARDVYLAAAIDRAVSTSGARVVSADGTANGDTPADAFMRSILDAAAAYERELIRARTKAALGAKRARGERAGTVPYGFTADTTGRLVACPAEQAVIAQVRALRTAGLSHRGIVGELERAGLVGRTGRPLGLSQVQNILAMEAA
jgi:DNA invertase Pin-like site-specific DNA recombinase